MYYWGNGILFTKDAEENNQRNTFSKGLNLLDLDIECVMSI